MMHHNHGYYIVIETKNITQDMVSESIHNSDTFRKCNNGIYCILKFNYKFPNTMAGYAKLNHDEIIAFLKTNSDEWEVNLEEIE